MPTPLTQSERSARTRADLLRAAEARFLRCGYHGTSLEDVARDVGYTKGAVYASFHNKANLFLVLCEEIFTRRVEEAGELLALKPEGRIDALARRATDPRADAWLLLCIEFWVTSAQQPEQLQAFARSYCAMRDGVAELISKQPGALGARRCAMVTLALTCGLALERLVDPAGVPDDLMAQTLRMLTTSAD